MKAKYSKKCTAANDTDEVKVEEVKQSDSTSGYTAPPTEIVAATVLTEQQFYDLFQGCFSGLEWLVNKRLAPEGIELTTIHIMEHEQATARSLCAEIYKIASEPGSPVSWMIAPPTRYGPMAILGFNFVMMKKGTISEELRALKAKDVTPDKPDKPEKPPENPETVPDKPESNPEKGETKK